MITRVPFTVLALVISISACSDDGTSSTDTNASVSASATTVASDALDQLPGVEHIEVTVVGNDATRPTFMWTAPAAAASSQLVVQTEDGTPLWAWTGVETQVVLGGTSRPTDVEGPTLTGPSRVRVYAFDGSNALVGVSSWTPAPGA